MTRPTDRRKRGFHVAEPGVYIGGVDGQPNGQPPPVAPPPTTDLPDRASSETGGAAFGLEDIATAPDDLNLLFGTDSDGGGNKTFSTPTEANDNDVSTNATVGSFAAGVGTYTGYLVADLGSAMQVDSLRVWGDTGCGTDPTGGEWSIEYSADNVTWTPASYTDTWHPNGTPLQNVEYVLAASVTRRYWRLKWTHTIAVGFEFVCGTDVHTFQINGPTAVTSDWTRAVPAVNDGDDSTSDTFPEAELIRLDLGGEFAIGRTRVRIETDTAGARELTITGANEADFSDGVVVRTINFTSTAAAQDVEDSWSPTDSYRYWQLDIDVPETTNLVYAWELYEIDATADALAHVDDPTDAHDASAISYDGTSSGLSSDNVQDAIDELDGLIAAGPSLDTLVWMPLTTVVGGDPVLVWDSDDSLIPTLVSV